MKHLIYRFYEDIICIPIITPYWAMCIGKEKEGMGLKNLSFLYVTGPSAVWIRVIGFFWKFI